jgi:hypothetical protein
LDDLAAKVGRGYLIEIEKSTGFLQALASKRSLLDKLKDCVHNSSALE